MTSTEVKAQAEELLKYWQRQLRLEDWDFTLTVPAHDPGGCAETKSSNYHGRAEITIRNPEMHSPDSCADPDLEVTLVHELLHARFKTIHLKRDTSEDEEFELAIERTAQALVHLNRGERR